MTPPNGGLYNRAGLPVLEIKVGVVPTAGQRDCEDIVHEFGVDTEALGEESAAWRSHIKAHLPTRRYQQIIRFGFRQAP